ncbi:MAG: hypothetical protein GX927_06475, partial [Lentisphaerae bacterium]|nr:hypothetical protein [Lentisphaerota bacterium]
GVSNQLCAVDPPVLQVPDYAEPGKGELNYDLNNKAFTINTPLSASYTLRIRYPNGNVKVVQGDYTPNNAGLILPELVLPMEFFAAGDYSATVFGTNPEGDGQVSEPCIFTIVDENAANLEWPAEGFVPADAANILVAGGADNYMVNFSWPVLSAAQSYNIVVINSAGAVVARANDLIRNTWQAKLPAPKDFNSYAWWVEAVAANQRAVSFTWGFNLIKKTLAPLLNAVTADDTGVILNFAAYGENLALVSYEVQYFSVDPVNIKNSKWYNFMIPGDVPLDAVNPPADHPTRGRLDLELPVNSKAGDFILLRAFYNGKQQGNFVLYSVQ